MSEDLLRDAFERELNFQRLRITHLPYELKEHIATGGRYSLGELRDKTREITERMDRREEAYLSDAPPFEERNEESRRRYVSETISDSAVLNRFESRISNIENKIKVLDRQDEN
jgi:hypothetical protein